MRGVHEFIPYSVQVIELLFNTCLINVFPSPVVRVFPEILEGLDLVEFIEILLRNPDV